MAPELTPEQRAVLNEVNEKFHLADGNLHRTLRQDWDHLHALYNNVNDWNRSLREASPRDRDQVFGDGQSTFGADLFIPYSYTTVETILPRMLSNRPKMLFLPKDPDSERNVQHVSEAFDAEQSQAGYELTLQSTAKSGLAYGLGVQKTMWRRSAKQRLMLAEGINVEFVEEVGEKVDFDGPDAQDVDIYDFLWDPFGTDLRTVTYVIHRTWRSTGYVLDRLAQNLWGPAAGGVDLLPVDLQGQGSLQHYSTVWAGRLNALGYPGSVPKGTIHEVWEFHDGTRVITILDRRWPMRVAENPAWHGELPFSVYRPTMAATKAFCGVGVIKPIVDLQAEINTLRSQRRDNAAYKLNPPLVYNQDLVNPTDVRFGPGQMFPVQGEPAAKIMQLQVGDIPNSGYQEEAALQGDIERTTGISDTVTGASSAGETATGVQLVQAAANIRIQNMAWRLTKELVQTVARHWLELNQQHIIEARTLRLPAEPTPGAPDTPWRWVTVGPAELAGEFDIEPDGGATLPSNVPQDRQDAQELATMILPTGLFDRQKLGTLIMSKMGVENPETYLAPPQEVPPQTLGFIKAELVQAGMDERMAIGVIGNAYNAALDQQEQQLQQVPQSPEPAQNGAAPA